MGWGFRFRRKVMLSTFAAVCFGMVLAAAGFVTVDVSATRALIRENLNAQADTLARNLGAALGFDDKQAAYEDLKGLGDHSHIIRAAVFKTYAATKPESMNKKVFAEYRRDKKSYRFPEIEKSQTDFWGTKSTWVIRPILQNKIQIGTIFLERSLSDVDDRFKRYTGMAFGVAGIGVIVTMIGALWFQSSLTRPILELSDTANSIAAKKNYSIRARKFSEDELGDLTDVFNDMLATVDEADRILKQSHEEMEQRVHRRTKQLTLANEKLVEEAKERMLAEEKLLDANRRLNVQEKLAAVGQVSANMAHELRNPHSAIRQSVYFLNKMVENHFNRGQKTKEKKIREHLDLIENELSRSDAVIDGLLGMSKGENLNIISFDLTALVNEVLKYCRLNENIHFVTDFPESPFLVFADPALFRQVFINLFTNAEQAMPEGGTITVRGESSSETKTIITVSDTGCGINEEDRKRVFDALLTTKVGGVGLGLSLCRDILQRHDGTITFKNGTDVGAKIVMTIPNKKNEGKKTNFG